MSKNVIIVSSLLIVAAVIGGVVIFSIHKDERSSKNEAKSFQGEFDDTNDSKKAIRTLCQPTSYRETCEKSMSSAAGNTSDFPELVKIGFKVAKREMSNALKKSKTIQAAKKDPRSAQALEICDEVVTYAVNDLERSVDSIGWVNSSSSSAVIDGLLEDIKVWLGGALTYQEVCFDAFENATDVEAGIKMRKLFNVSRMMTSNALAMVDEVEQFFNLMDLESLGLTSSTSTRRRLLITPTEEAGVMPIWVTDRQRRILNRPIQTITPDAVVALDGSGDYTDINDAVNKIPNNNTKPFIIYIKTGVYKQHVNIAKKMTNVVFIGDGPTKTVITGDRSFTAGYQTFKTATVAIMGDGFMAKGIGFENTAGPQGHQAVAIRVTGDYAVFYNCRFDGYQDTLYAVRSRQFYRDCTVTGTIDFIFGNALAVFQNCTMLIRKPLPNQHCMVTAQGRNDTHSPGITLIQGCNITGTADFMAVKGHNKAYLGRPWKEYSRTIVINSYISDAIEPEGWTPWSGDFALNTLFYAEYNNTGPGADLSRRVNWPGYNKLTPQLAHDFSPENIFKGSAWIMPTGAPYTAHTN